MDKVVTELLNKMRQLRPRRDSAQVAAQAAINTNDLVALREATKQERALVAEFAALHDRIRDRMAALKGDGFYSS